MKNKNLSYFLFLLTFDRMFTTSLIWLKRIILDILEVRNHIETNVRIERDICFIIISFFLFFLVLPMQLFIILILNVLRWIKLSVLPQFMVKTTTWWIIIRFSITDMRDDHGVFVAKIFLLGSFCCLRRLWTSYFIYWYI